VRQEPFLRKCGLNTRRATGFGAMGAPLRKLTAHCRIAVVDFGASLLRRQLAVQLHDFQSHFGAAYMSLTSSHSLTV
jgi:hypothetical protein